MGRYKLGPQGGYYDPNDSGPDQFTPQPGQQYPGMPAPQQAQQQDPSQQPFPLPGPHQGPWMPPVIDSPPGYDPNHPAHEVGGIGGIPANGGINGGPAYQDWRTSPEGQQYTDSIKAGGNPNAPMGGSLGSLSGMTKTAPQSLAQMGGWAKPTGQTGGTLSSLMNGGNLAGTGSAFGALFGKR